MEETYSNTYNLHEKFALRTFRVYLFLITLTLAESFASELYGQLISLNMEDTVITEVLDVIEQETDFHFFYNTTLVDMSRRVSIHVVDKPIDYILNHLFGYSDIDFKIYKNQIVLFPKNEDAVLTLLEELTNYEPNSDESPKESRDHITIALAKAVQDPISGTVKDENGQPLPGVTIIVEGTTRGTLTDFDGNFSIIAGPEDVLVFSYVGMMSQHILVGSNQFVNIALIPDLNELEEVVVTSFGIKREKKALGYAVSTLESDQVSNRPEPSIGKILQGKLAGVQISVDSGATGDDVDINVRSQLSITGANEPLIVLDGVIFTGSYNDIDPNNIRNISVLKGLNAALAYGSRGRNGVLLIETISADTVLGEKQFSASVSHTTYSNEVVNFPDYQKKYGTGADFRFAETIGSWGPAYSTLDSIPHPYSEHAALFPEFLNATTPYRPYNNTRDFFRKGFGNSTSVRIAMSQPNTAFNASLGYLDEEGIVEFNDMTRFNFSLGGSMKISDRLSLNSNVYYTHRNYRFVDDDLFDQIFLMTRGVNLKELPYQNPITGSNIYYRADRENPYWTLNNTGLLNEKVRIAGNLDMSFKVSDKVNVSYTVGLEHESFDEFDYANRGGVDGQHEFGFLSLDHDLDFALDQRFLLSFDNFRLSDKLGLDAFVGASSNYFRETSNFSRSEDQIVFGFLRPDNFRVTEANFHRQEENLFGVFGQLGFHYANALYFTLSGRNDWGSTVEPQNRQVFYPGASLSVIPTSLFEWNSDVVNFLKLRAAYATSSGYPRPYNTRVTILINERRFVLPDGTILVTNRVDTERPTFDLKPELHREVELGLEGSFLNNRVQLEVSAYERQSNDQILERNYDFSTGAESSFLNIGRVDTRGLEVELDVDLLRQKDWGLHQRTIFNTYKTEVVDVPENEILLTPTSAKRFAIKGEELGVIKGSYFLTDDEGNRLIHPETGEAMVSDEYGFEDRILGSPTPDFTLTSITGLSFKNLSLSAQWEWTQGGVVLSNYVETIIERGVTRDTENREGSFVIPGVLGDPETGTALLDGDQNKIPNDIQLNANRIGFGNLFESDEGILFDATVFRLREVQLSYHISKKQWPQMPFKDMSISLSGQNLWYNAPYLPRHINYDPEHDGGLGRSIKAPTNKRFALGITLNF